MRAPTSVVQALVVRAVHEHRPRTARRVVPDVRARSVVVDDDARDLRRDRAGGVVRSMASLVGDVGSVPLQRRSSRTSIAGQAGAPRSTGGVDADPIA